MQGVCDCNEPISKLLLEVLELTDNYSKACMQMETDLYNDFWGALHRIMPGLTYVM